MPVLGLAMLASICVTEALLGMEGRWAEALPLHLCSIAAILSLFVAAGARGWALDFLWYLGIPGASLALAFPAPAVSARQALFNAAYLATHALILLIPAQAILRGDWPRRGRALRMLLLLQGLALAAYAANRALGTDFMFLMGPPANTPVAPLFARSRAAYYAALEALMAGLALLMQAARALRRGGE